MRRIAASKFGKSEPESDRDRPALPPARRAASPARRAIGRPTRQRYRPGFGPPPRPAQARSRFRARAAKQVEGARELVDNFPEEIAVLPGELKVIETYLAMVLDETFEQLRSQTDGAASDTAKCDVEEQY